MLNFLVRGKLEVKTQDNNINQRKLSINLDNHMLNYY